MKDYLEDKLIEGTSGFEGYMPPLGLHKQGKVVPRIFPVYVRQTNDWGPDYLRTEAYQFIGKPVNDVYLQKIRSKNKLSSNYGAVILPKELMKNIDRSKCRLIVDEDDTGYTVVGLLPTKTLRWDARRETSDEEGIVYGAMIDFPSLDPKQMMKKWGRFSIDFNRSSNDWRDGCIANRCVSLDTQLKINREYYKSQKL